MPAPVTPIRARVYTPARLSEARAQVTRLAPLAPPHSRMLAWATLMHARGHRVRQGVLNSIITGRRTRTGALTVRRTP